MRQGEFLGPNFFSLAGVGPTFFKSRCTFQRPIRKQDANGEIRFDLENSWESVLGLENIPCGIAPEVLGRPASSTEYQNSAPRPYAAVEVDYQYLMLNGNYQGIEKRFRVIVDGSVYTSSPNPDYTDKNVWGLEEDSQKVFTRLRVYTQKS